MRMNIILGSFLSSAVILASAFIYMTADAGATEISKVVYVPRVVERVVKVPVEVEVERIILVPTEPAVDPEAIFADTPADEKLCLAHNIYFESRGESHVGQEFVAWVTLNRVLNSDFPNTICGVVWQKSQFSWTHDDKSDNPSEAAAWATAQSIADEVLDGYGVDRDPTEGATYFHAASVAPVWRKRFDRVVQIDGHIFYADNG